MDYSVWIISGVIIGTGYVLRQSLINKINEGFKNESYEKQKRWDLKQKIYFELLENLYNINYYGKKVFDFAVKHKDLILKIKHDKELYKTEIDEIVLNNKSDFNVYLDMYNKFKNEMDNLKKHLAVSQLILNPRSHEELENLSKIIVDDFETTIFETTINLAKTSFDNITTIAKEDLKIDSPL